MESILQCAYIDERCNACGGSYRVTLYEALQRTRLEDDWVSARPVEACHAEYDALLAAIPRDALEAVEDAWRNLARQLPGSLPLQLSRPSSG